MEISFKKFLFGSIAGFWLGGLLWGLILYFFIPNIDYPLNIFAVLVGIFGGVGLTIFSKNVKQIVKSAFFGFLGSLIGIIVAFFGIYGLFLLGTWFLSFLPISYKLIKSLELYPALKISAYWLNFFLAGSLTGLFFAFVLKRRIWALVWRGGVGFGLSSIISPILGNLIGNFFGSILASYLITFSIIGIILGLFFAWGAHSGVARPSGNDKTVRQK